VPLSPAKANDLAADLHKAARPEWARLRRFARYARGKQAPPWLPDNVESEYKDIAKKSASNWLDLVVRATTQGLHVDGYGDDSGNSSAWLAWQLNGLDMRQNALHRAVETLGYSYLLVFPSEDEQVPWMRPEAATSCFAAFDDPGDDWPLYALREVQRDRRYELYDNEARYIIEGSPGKGQVKIDAHDLEVTPAIQMVAEVDLLGLPMGAVESVLPIQDRIVDATFTLQMVAKYGAFPQRWIAGLQMGADDEGNPLPPKIKAYVDHILMAANPDTKFGQFAAADLKQYVEALEAHIRHLAAITQTPPHYLLGSLVNLSAEALAAAESGLQRKIKGRQEVLGERYEQALRLAALIMRDELAARDITSHVHWQDVESRSLAQVADALVKLKDVGVPLPMLLQMIPGWTKTDVNDAVKLMEQGDPVAALTGILERQAA
jgi:hypothetical protein